VRSLAVSCLICHHKAVLAVDKWPDHAPVPSFGPRMVCAGCRIIGADARPNWSERPVRPTVTGALMARRPAAEMIADPLSLLCSAVLREGQGSILDR
jgi:hypothetical protein